jgi:hypothetical protein
MPSASSIAATVPDPLDRSLRQPACVCEWERHGVANLSMVL